MWLQLSSGVSYRGALCRVVRGCRAADYFGLRAPRRVHSHYLQPPPPIKKVWPELAATTGATTKGAVCCGDRADLRLVKRSCSGCRS